MLCAVQGRGVRLAARVTGRRSSTAITSSTAILLVRSQKLAVSAGQRGVSTSAQLVREVRRRTLSDYTECKKALAECNDDVDKAVELLRKRGATKKVKADRISAEGLIAVATGENVGVLLEVHYLAE